MAKMRLFLVIFLVLFHVSHVQAQKQVINQRMAWYGYFLNLLTAPRSSLQLEMAERRFLPSWNAHQTFFRAHFHQAIGQNGWEASLGGCLFLTRPNDPESSNRLAVPELRPHVEMASKQQMARWRIDHRYRLEARFFHTTNVQRTELENGYVFGSFRFRYRIQATCNLFRIDSVRFARFRINDELHINLGRNIVTNVFDQNRFSMVLSVDVTKSLAVDLGWMNWFQQIPDRSFYNRQNFIVNMVQTLNLDGRK